MSEPNEPPSETDMWWYLNVENKPTGPYNLGYLAQLFNTGDIDGFTMFWKEGRSEWKILSEIDQLKQDLLALKGTEEDIEDLDNFSETKIPGDEIVSSIQPENIEIGNLPVTEDRNKNAEIQHETASHTGLHTEEIDIKALQEAEEKRIEKKRKRERQRFKKLLKNNTSIYISQGIPKDATEEEMVQVFQKCGIIKFDIQTGKPKVKFYKDESGNFKGEALVTYALMPSVENALQLLDNTEFRPGFEPKMKIQKAEFQMKGDSFIPRKRTEKGKLQENYVSKAISWSEGIDDGRGLRIIILKHVFDPSQAKDSSFYEEIEEDILEEASKLGEVEKVTVFERNPLGPVAVKFKESSAAEECIVVMNGRWFDGKQIVAEYFDGKTNYRYQESEEEKAKRLKEWNEWLEGNENT